MGLLLGVRLVGRQTQVVCNNGVAEPFVNFHPEKCIPEFPSRSSFACGRRLLVQPEAGIGPLLAALYRARHRLFLKIFALEDPSLIQAVIDAHHRGVDCRVQLNRLRADGTLMNLETMAQLTAAGVPTIWTNPEFDVTHEKSLVIDDEAWICTFNFSRKFFEKVRGYAVITQRTGEINEIVACFQADWERREFANSGELMFGGVGSRERILELIDSAQHSLDIQHKKLADTAVLAHLLKALARGVKVRFLGSGQKGVHGADLYENAATLGILKSAGGLVHRLKKPKIHAKLIIVDGKVAHVGSMNLTRHCFEHRREIGLVVDSQPLVGSLQEVFERDWILSRDWTPPTPLP